MEDARLLLVDDDRTFSTLTQEYLESKGYRADLCHSSDDALAAYRQRAYDLCVLDVRMPMKDGFSLAADLRAIDPDLPIIFLTGMVEKEQKIKGLRLGADDYITKPFSMEELFLRIQNILRRAGRRQQQVQEANQVLSIGLFQLHTGARELIGPTGQIKLTAIEASLLQAFAESENGLLDRRLALKRIWGDDDYLKGRSLNVYVSKLRKMLEGDSRIEILNVHGVGYRLVVR